jgi:hypothetical protein
MAKTDLQGALRTLLQKQDCRVYPNKTIEVLKNQTQIGNGGWSKIDYLKKEHGFSVDIVEKFGKR